MMFGVEILRDWLLFSFRKVHKKEYILLWLTFLAIMIGEPLPGSQSQNLLSGLEESNRCLHHSFRCHCGEQRNHSLPPLCPLLHAFCRLSRGLLVPVPLESGLSWGI